MNTRGWHTQANFGNALNEHIIRHLTGDTVVLDNAAEVPSYLLIGAGFQHLKTGDKVWGAGVRDAVKLVPGVKLLAVRGPKSAQKLSAAGYDLTTTVLGDPGCFVPLVFPHPEEEVKGRIGFAPHFYDKTEQPAGTVLINVADPPAEVVRQIKRCTTVISSSLHVLIAAQSLGKPVVWWRPTNFEEPEDKYLDWFANFYTKVTCYTNDKFELEPALSNRFMPPPQAFIWEMQNRLRTALDVPLRKREVAVITCHFNFAGYETPRKNLERFMRQMEFNKVEVYGIELVSDKPAVSAKWPTWKQIKVNAANCMWQKELLLNMAEKVVHKDYQNIAWIDEDISFDYEFWPTYVAHELKTAKIVQLFEYMRFLGQKGQILAVDSASDKLKVNHRMPGYAWAARRELWQHGGLYDRAIVGAGDMIMVSVFNHTDPFEKGPSDLGTIKDEAGLAYLAEYTKTVQAWLGRSVKRIPLTLTHYWHGDKKNRNYLQRTDLVKGVDWSMIDRDNNGLWRFNDKAPAGLAARFLEFFQERKEDGGTFDDVLMDFFVQHQIALTNYPELNEAFLNHVQHIQSLRANTGNGDKPSETGSASTKAG